MSLFNKKKNQGDDNVYIPQIVSATPAMASQSTQDQIALQRMNLEQSRLANQARMVECVNNAIPVVINGVRDVAGFVSDCVQMHQRTKQLQMMTNVELANITARYEVVKEYMMNSFGERSKSLNKFYNTLDKALECDDRDLIIASMQSISNVVATSPLQDIEKFKELFNDTSRPLLDF